MIDEEQYPERSESRVRDEKKTKAELIAEISELRRHLGLFKSMVEDSQDGIVVSDAGRGVPEDFLPRLFERFSRAERESKPGTGLGLHLARQLCRVMGGDLTYLPPADGEGPRFVVSLAAG